MIPTTRKIIRDGKIITVPPMPPPCAYPGTPRTLPWKYDAGEGGDAGGNSCVERALTIATGLPRKRIVQELELAPGTTSRSATATWPGTKSLRTPAVAERPVPEPRARRDCSVSRMAAECSSAESFRSIAA